MRGQWRGRRGGFRGRFRGRGGYRGGYQGQHYPKESGQMKREKERAERSVVVRGFASETTVTELSQFFQNYGTMENIMLNCDKDSELHALVVFENKEAADKLKDEPDVTLNDCKLKIEEKKSRLDFYQEHAKLTAGVVKHPEQTVWVKGIPKSYTEQDIKEFFSKHGEVVGVLPRQDFRRGEIFHYVQFDSKNDASAVIAMETLDFHGETLTVDHKKTREEVSQKRQNEANHSVYVQGFSEDTTVDQIKSVFQSVGNVEKVYLGQRNKFAFVEFNSPEEVEAAVAMENLSIGDNLLIVKRREADRKVDVSNKFFGPRKPPVDFIAVLKSLLQLKSVEEQMSGLQEALQMTDEDVSQRQAVCDQLQDIFTEYFPGSSVEQFGSGVNGFGMKGSDLDVFLDLHLDEPEPSLEGYPRKPVPYIADIPTLTVEQGMITRESLSKTGMPDRVKLISRALKADTKGFSGFITIRAARCPVIRMLHNDSGMRIDLSINNKLALHNTRLIRMYADYDPRVRPLFYALRLWARYKDLSGGAVTGAKLTSYALSLLLFHFLTKCTPPVLPTVQQIAEIAEKKTMIEGWDCSLPSDKSKLPPISNTDPIIDLFIGFFHYYAHYNWAGMVMKTRTSEIVERPAFQAELDAAKQAQEGLPEEERQRLPKIGPVTVIDPFVTAHNITFNCSPRLRFRLKYEFEQANAKVQHERFTRPPPESAGQAPEVDWGLCFLFSRDRLRIQQLDDGAQLAENGINLFHVAPYHLPISMKISTLPQSLVLPGPDKEAFKDKWTNEILHFIQKILIELMLIECTDASEVLSQQMEMLGVTSGVTIAGTNNENGKREAVAMETEQEIESKRLKLETIDPNSIILALKCTTRCRMWQNRKQVRKEVRAQMEDADEFTLEAAVTEKLSKAHPPLLDSVIEFYLTFIKDRQPHGFSCIRMSMYPLVGAKEFTCFFAFLSSFVARVVDKCFILKE